MVAKKVKLNILSVIFSPWNSLNAKNPNYKTPVWQMTRKNPKNKRDFARGPTWPVHPTVDLALNFHKKIPIMFLVP